MKEKKRCHWVNLDDKLYVDYHDSEWGVPVHDDKKIFEFLVLESAQAGLSWITILRKRENYRKAFSGFDYKKIAKYTNKDVSRLLKNAGIIRNHLKIEATINNAKRFLEVQKEFGTFSRYMWGFVGGKTINHKIKSIKDYKPTTKEAEIFANDLKARGFKFLGPVVVYAHMQAVGMVNDHINYCFRYKN
jgi:DNA-3-methyladenine glycosylase I